ncbi:interferon-inducible GTPase 1-like [Mus pahari]|uniref:interferon-inducible GTPase 1-like n=1 Tax=Mus pahari TaxID=10093 RepID=UPI000A30EB64|nr:interferon-inducible GTPase 1-like [Mus pahari]
MGLLFSKPHKDGDHGNLESGFTKYFKNYEPETKIISEATTHLIELCLEKGDINGANSIISDALKNIDNATINIAVTGESGAGKSSLINALRGVKHEGKDAAEVGVTETTMKVAPYEHPKVKNLTLWELPGIGTLKFPPKDYLEKVNFEKYDFFIIVSATQLTKHELDLAKAIRIRKKNYYLVRSKVDCDLENEKKSKPRSFNRENTLNKIRNYYLDALKENKIDEPQVFLISNFNLSDYDFPVLMDTLVKDLPAEKRLLLSLLNITEAAIQKKYNSAKQTILLKSMLDGFVVACPILSILKVLDKERLKKHLDDYRDLFGVDDKSLMFMAADAQVPVELLKKKLKSPYLLELKEETLEGLLFKYVEKIAIATGGFLATGLYLKKTYYLQLYFLDTVAEDAKVLLQEAYSKK